MWVYVLTLISLFLCIFSTLHHYKTKRNSTAGLQFQKVKIILVYLDFLFSFLHLFICSTSLLICCFEVL